MICSKCGQTLRIANSKMESELNSTDVYNIQTLVCINENCPIYTGKDLENPSHIANVKKHKVG